MKIIGLTGGIATGKSTVSNIFVKSGIPVIDADKIAKEAVLPNTLGWKKLIYHFGENILLANDNHIDREKLGKIIFENELERHYLNEILHPIIRAEMAKKATFYKECGYKFIVIDIPLLYETRDPSTFDLILVVYAREEIQIERLITRNSYSKQDAINRVKSQYPIEEKAKLADIVINNEGSIEETTQQTNDFIEKMKLWYNSNE